VCPLPGHRPPLGAVRLGRVRLLRQPLRYCWGLRLHLLSTLHGLPIGFALTGAKAEEHEVLLDILDTDPALTAERVGQPVIAEKNYYGREFETTLAEAGLNLLRPARKGEPPRAGARFFKPAPGGPRDTGKGLAQGGAALAQVGRRTATRNPASGVNGRRSHVDSSSSGSQAASRASARNSSNP
jgi:hypothetical protein